MDAARPLVCPSRSGGDGTSVSTCSYDLARAHVCVETWDFCPHGPDSLENESQFFKLLKHNRIIFTPVIFLLECKKSSLSLSSPVPIRLLCPQCALLQSPMMMMVVVVCVFFTGFTYFIHHEVDFKDGVTKVKGSTKIAPTGFEP